MADLKTKAVELWLRAKDLFTAPTKAAGKSAAALGEEARTLRSRLSELKTLDAEVGSIVKLKAATADAESTLKGLTEQLTEAQAESATAAEAYVGATRKVEALREEQARLKEALGDSAAAQRRATEVSQQAASAARENQTQLDAAWRSVAKLGDQTEAASIKVRAMQRDLDAQQQAITTLGPRTAETAKAHDKLTESIASLKGKLGEAQNSASGLSDAYQRQVQQTRDLGQRQLELNQGAKQAAQAATDQRAAHADLKSALSSTGAALREASAEERAAGKASKEADKSVADLTAQVEKANVAWIAQRRELREVEGSLQRAGVDLTDLRAAQEKVGAQTDEAREALGRHQKELRESGEATASLTTRTGGLVKGLLATAAAYIGLRELAGFFTDSVKEAAAFEQQMDAVAAVSGAVGSEFEAMAAAAREAGANTTFTATEAAQALENLARAGLKPKESIEALNPALALARGNSLDLGEAASYLTTVTAAMNLRFEESGRVADVLTKGAASANTTVEQLANALSYAGPVAVTAGMSIEQVTAIIGVFSNAGIQGERAGTAFRSILAQMSDPASQASRALRELGIATDDPTQALIQLAEKGAAGQSAVRAFGMEAGPALQAALNQGTEALERQLREIAAHSGAAQNAANIMNDNLSGAVTALGSAWDALRERLVRPLLKPLQGEVEGLTTYLRDLAKDPSVDEFGRRLVEMFKNGAAAVKSFLSGFDFAGAMDATSEFGKTASESFRSISAAATGVTAAFKIVFNMITSNVSRVAGGITSMVATALDGVSKLAEWAGRDELAKSTRETAEVLKTISDGYRQQVEQDTNDIKAAWNSLTETQETSAKVAKASADEHKTAAETQLTATQQLAAGTEAYATKVEQARAKLADLAASGTASGAELEAATRAVAAAEAERQQALAVTAKSMSAAQAEEKAAADKVAEARAKLNELVNSGIASAEQLALAAANVTAAEAEQEKVAARVGAALAEEQAATQTLAEAKAKLSALMLEGISSNEQLLAAQEAVTAAEQRLDAARVQSAESSLAATQRATEASAKAIDAAQQLGVDVALVTTGISKAGAEAIGQFSNVASGVLKGYAGGSEIIIKGFEAALAKMSRPKEVAELEKALESAFKAGKLSAEQYKKEVELAKQRTQELAATADDELNRAYETLNVTTTAMLKAAAAKAVSAYETIKASGTATAADLEKAWLAQARAQVEAYGEVRAVGLQAAADVMGIGDEFRKLTEAVLGTGDAAEESGDKITEANERTRQSTRDLREEMRGLSDDIQQVEGSLYSMAASADTAISRLRDGVSVANTHVQGFTQEMMTYYTELTTRSNALTYSIQAQQSLWESAARQTRERNAQEQAAAERLDAQMDRTLASIQAQITEQQRLAEVGSLTAGQLAQRMATLNAQAEATLRTFERQITSLKTLDSSSLASLRSTLESLKRSLATDLGNELLASIESAARLSFSHASSGFR